jgi:hypothetical protein
MSERVVFAAICPVCWHGQMQHGFNVASLRQLLQGGHAIEAYCERCDECWSLSVQQRGELDDIVGFRPYAPLGSLPAPPA